MSSAKAGSLLERAQDAAETERAEALLKATAGSTALNPTPTSSPSSSEEEENVKFVDTARAVKSEPGPPKTQRVSGIICMKKSSEAG
jgi:hypothetical protein